jgi:hypothetical protein
VVKFPDIPFKTTILNVHLFLLEKRTKYTIQLSGKADPALLGKGCWIAVLHAERIPPHIGLVFNGLYCSLNIKGKEKDVEIPVLLRKIGSQQISTLFVKLVPHPVFSVDFLHEHFKLELEKYERVSVDTTCFAPVRSFMQENYLLRSDALNYLYELFPALYREKMISDAFGLHLGEEKEFHLEPYTAQEIEDKLNGIEQVSKQTEKSMQ